MLLGPNKMEAPGGGFAQETGFLDLALQALHQIEDLLGKQPQPYDFTPQHFMQFEADFARALLAKGKNSEALDRALRAQRWGKDASVPAEIMKQREELVSECQRRLNQWAAHPAGVPAAGARVSADDLATPGAAGAADSAASERPELCVGDAAPGLAIAEWLKGEPVTALALGKVYVVEFWAVWCGPCHGAILHLTELQRKHPKATVIGIADRTPDIAKVKEFVAEKADEIGYAIALEAPASDGGERGQMCRDWLEASCDPGFPTTYIVDGVGKIAWIGHPMAVEETLIEVLEGRFDIAAAARKLEHFKLFRLREKAAILACAKGLLAKAEGDYGPLYRIGVTLLNAPMDPEGHEHLGASVPDVAALAVKTLIDVEPLMKRQEHEEPPTDTNRWMWLCQRGSRTGAGRSGAERRGAIARAGSFEAGKGGERARGAACENREVPLASYRPSAVLRCPGGGRPNAHFFAGDLGQRIFQ